MKTNYEKLGKRIKSIRKNSNITQEQLAEMTGLSNNYISNIERNRSIPSIETLLKICNSLKVTPDLVLLDSIYMSREYIKDEIARKLDKCNDKNIKLISKFLDVLIEEQDDS
ncbi:helix-turn-helix domain-containing protein [Clostridium sp. LBM24168]